MRNPENVLNSLSKHSKNSGYKFERLYRILFNREMYLMAYQKIYANEGNMTKGSDGQTIDSMSLKRIGDLIESLKDESYMPNPSRRTYIPKKTGKMRPLGIPSFIDKLLQEVIRMILEAIYEGYFEETSHGFRPDRSCHTALSKIQGTFTGVKWFIEGDIKGFFDNINHDVMISTLEERVNDERFLRLIRKFLNAGYIEDWRLCSTYSGTPQGGIISPILANIYLDKFDKYIKEYSEKFNKGNERKVNLEYHKLVTRKTELTKRLEASTDEVERTELIKAIREIEKTRCNVPYGVAMDENFRRMKYVRYADDFLIGIIGSKDECRTIRSDIKEYLFEKLKLELSDEKTLITHAQTSAKFLGYNIYVRISNLAKRDCWGRLKRDYTGRIVLEISGDTMKKKLLEYKVMRLNYHNGKEIWKPLARYYMKDNDDLEILDQYNTEIRGFYNYFSLANNSSIINAFKYIMEYSMYKTYATKYRTSKTEIIKKFGIGKDFGIKFKTSSGKEKIRLFYNEGFKRKKLSKGSESDIIPDTIKFRSSTSLVDRLKAGKCELCRKENTNIEIHHVRKLKNLQGKSYWEAFMIARRRKTLALCRECHNKIHCGKMD